MVGISSLADSFTGEEAAASGIGRYFRSGRRLGRRGKPSVYGSVSMVGGGGFGGFRLIGGRGIEDAVGQRSERGLQGRQDLLPGADRVIQGINFGFDLRAEFVGSAPELIDKARDLASDLGHFLGAKKDQRQEKQEDHLAGEAEIHSSIIMRDGDTGHSRVGRRRKSYKAEERKTCDRRGR